MDYHVQNHNPNFRRATMPVSINGELVVNEYEAANLKRGVEIGELFDTKDKNLINIQGILAEVESRKY